MSDGSRSLILAAVIVLLACSAHLVSYAAEAPVFRLVAQSGHEMPVSALALSMDGHIAVTASSDRSIIVWDTFTGRVLRKLRSAAATSVKVAISANTSYLLVISQNDDPFPMNPFAVGLNETAQVWNLETGEEVAKWSDKNTGGKWCAFTNLSDNIVVADNKGHTVLWDLRSKQAVRSFPSHNDKVNVVVVSPRDELVFTGGRDGLGQLSQISTGNPIATLRGDSGPILSAAFSLDSKYVLIGCKGSTVVVWSTDLTQDSRRIRCGGQAWSVGLSPNGSSIAVGGPSGLLQLFSFETGQKLWEKENILEDTGLGWGVFVRSLAFSPDGHFIYAQSSFALVFEVVSGERVKKFGRLWAAAFSFDGSQILCSTEQRTLLRDSASGRAIRAFDGRVVPPQSVQLSPNGRALLVAVGDSAVVMDLVSGRTTHVFGPQNATVNAAIFSGDGSRVITGSEAGTCDIWDAVSDRLEKSLPSGGHVQSVTASADGKYIAAGGDGPNVIVWDASTYAPVVSLSRKALGDRSVRRVAFDVTGKTICVEFDIAEVVCYSTSAGAPQKKFGGKEGPSSCLSADGRYVLVRRYPANAKVADVLLGNWPDTNSKLVEIASGKSVELQDAGSYYSVFSLSPDGNYLAAGSINGDVTVWSLKTPKSRTLKKHTGLITGLGFSADSKLLFTTGDSFVRVWGVPSAIETGLEKGSLLFSPDGTWMFISAENRFDTNDPDRANLAHWLIPDDPLKAMPIEIYFRDYYEPRLLPRILKGKKFCDLPSLAELNRAQPKIEKITVIPQADDPGLVTVRVEVSSLTGRCLKDGKHVSCESGVYDLRLYRDGQIVGQTPAPSGDVATSSCPGPARAEKVQRWRASSVVRTKTGQPVTIATGAQEITFSGIRLPQRSGVSQVEFTAYAFNEDRVKSATIVPTVYQLPQPRPNVRRRAYLATVGVDATSDPSLRLGFAPKGAREIERVLKESLRSQYEVVTVPLISEYKEESNELVQDLATKSNLQTVLSIFSGHNVTSSQRHSLPNQELLQAATPDDLVMLYIASHGYADPNGEFYVVPSDVGEPAGVSEQLLDRCLKSSERSASCQSAREFLRNSISSNELTQWLQTVDAGQIVLVLDSCHSGAVSGPDFKPGPMGDRGFGQLSYDKGMLVLAATQAENVDWGALELGDRSLLSYALTQQQTAGQSFDLKQWLSNAEKQVPELYRRFVKEKQEPTEEEQEPALFDFSKKRVGTR